MKVLARAWNPPPARISMREDVLPVARVSRASVFAALEKLDNARRFAPRAVLQPNESAFPMAPIDFLRVCRFCKFNRLAFTSWRYNKDRQNWVKQKNDHSAANYDIPVSYINRWDRKSNGGKDRHPCAHGSPKLKVGINFWLEARHDRRDLIAGETEPTGRVPAFYYFLLKRSNCCKKHNADYGIQYWFFYGENPWKNYHQGDWEHVTIFVKDGNPIGAEYAQHGDLGGWRDLDDLDRLRSGHFIVYVAEGSHASYASTGYKWFETATIKSSGPRWDTWERLQPLAAQPWKDFAGAWGSIKGGGDSAPCTALRHGVSGPLIQAGRGTC